jgi:hypothetical protein
MRMRIRLRIQVTKMMRIHSSGILYIKVHLIAIIQLLRLFLLFTFSYMDATDIMSENVHLRELLLSHLDIIQQQVPVFCFGTRYSVLYYFPTGSAIFLVWIHILF